MSKPTQSLVALKRIPNSGRYGTRMLLAGDSFEATTRDAKVLVAAKIAKKPRDIGSVPPPPSSLRTKVKKKVIDEPSDDLAAARAEYQEKVGKRPYMGWDAETVRAKMTENASDESGGGPTEAAPVAPMEAPAEEPSTDADATES